MHQLMLKELKSKCINEFLTKEYRFTKKDYVASSSNFDNAYNLSPTDTIYLYYAASTAVNARQYDRSLEFMKNLENLSFTGIEKISLLLIKSTGERRVLIVRLERFSVKQVHIQTSREYTESKFPEIVKNIALIY